MVNGLCMCVSSAIQSSSIATFCRQTYWDFNDTKRGPQSRDQDATRWSYTGRGGATQETATRREEETPAGPGTLSVTDIHLKK